MINYKIENTCARYNDSLTRLLNRPASSVGRA